VLFGSETAFDVLNVNSAVAINVQLLKCLRCDGLSFRVHVSGQEFQECGVVCVEIFQDSILFGAINCYAIVTQDLLKLLEFNDTFLVVIKNLKRF
jgi:hypothetical protein